MAAPRSFFEAVGGALGATADAYPRFYEMAQRKKRGEEEQAYREQQDAQQQFNADRIFSLQQGRDARDQAAYDREVALDDVARTAGMLTGRGEYGWMSPNQPADTEFPKTWDQAYIQTGYEPGMSFDDLRRLRQQSTWDDSAVLQRQPAFKPPYEPKGAADAVTEELDRHKKGLTANYIRRAQEAIPPDKRTALRIAGAADFGPTLTSMQSGMGLPGIPEAAKQIASFADSVNYINSPQYDQAWLRSPDSLGVANPGRLRMIEASPEAYQYLYGQPPPAANPFAGGNQSQSQTDAAGWAAQNIEGWSQLPPEKQQAVIQKRLQEMGVR